MVIAVLLVLSKWPPDRKPVHISTVTAAWDADSEPARDIRSTRTSLCLSHKTYVELIFSQRHHKDWLI